jgi:hypothetical protein
MSIVLRLVLPCMLLVVWQPADAQLYIPPKELVHEAPIIGVLPAQLPLPGADGKAAAASIDRLLATALRDAGFEVHDADAYRSVEDEYRRLSGGWFDPFTGQMNEPVWKAAINRTFSEFQYRHKLSGFARAHVESRMIEFQDSARVTWDGVQEAIVAKEGAMAAVSRTFGAKQQGRIGVMSLKLEVFDAQGRPIYDAAGGIGAMALLVDKHFIELDYGALLADEARITRALQVILWPLAHEGTAAPIEQFTGQQRQRGIRVPLSRAPAPLPPSLPRSQIKQEVMTIVLEPLDLSGQPGAEAVQRRYEQELTTVLTAAGFRVTPSSAYASALDAAAREIGGMYDPLTGELIAAKQESAKELARRRLRNEGAVDAVLTAAFEVVPASYDVKGEAAWDGIAQSVFATPAGWNGKAYSGVQPALSLAVKLADLSGKHLYAGRGGIGLVAWYLNGDFEPRPRDQMLLDEGTSARAVRLALERLSEGE